MWKQYRVLGIIISLGIGLAAVPIKLTGDDVHSGGLFLAARTIRYVFTAGLLAFFLHIWLNRRFASLLKRWRNLTALFNILLVALIICLVSVLLDIGFGEFLKKSSLAIPIADVNWYLVIFRCILLSGVQFFIVFYLQLLRERQNRNLEIERLRQVQLEANLSNLKEQLSPHFLFNTLNTLVALTQEQPVKDFVSELASVYRYMLMHNKMNLVPLVNELNFIRSYLYIIKTRLGDAIEIDIRLEEAIMQTPMPPLTLQILLENAIKHNVASVRNPLRIELYNESSFIVLKNSFIPKKSPYPSTGVGLNNLMNRYQLLLSRNIVIESHSDLFAVKLPIHA